MPRHFRGFLDRELLDGAQHEDDAVGIRERVDPRLDQLPHLAAQCHVVGSIHRGSLALGSDVVRGLARGRVVVDAQGQDRRAPCVLAQAAERLVGHDPGEPCRKSRVAAERRDRAVSLQVGLLHRVLGFAVVLQNRSRRSEERPIVPAHQLLESGEVACLDPPGKRRIAQRRRGGRQRDSALGFPLHGHWMSRRAAAFPARNQVPKT